MKPTQPYETFIRQMLSSGALSDAIRKVAPATSSIDSFFDELNKMFDDDYVGVAPAPEEQLDFVGKIPIEFFDATGYASDTKKESVLEKLESLQSTLLQRPNTEENLENIKTVECCIYYVRKNYALTKSLTETLNEIYAS
jgi:hypothetical protein